MTTRTPPLTDVYDPHGRVVPTTLTTPPAVAPAAERTRQAVAHELRVEDDNARIAKALKEAPNADARAAIVNPDAPRTEPVLEAELKESKAALFAAQQAVKAVRREQHAAIVDAAPEWIPELLDGIAEDRDAILAAVEQADQAFRSLARREQLITLLQQIQNGDNIWEWLDTVDRVSDKRRGKAAERIESRVASIGGLPADLQSRELMLEALRHHASVVADGMNPEARRGRLLRPDSEAA